MCSPTYKDHKDLTSFSPSPKLVLVVIYKWYSNVKKEIDQYKMRVAFVKGLNQTLHSTN